MAQLEDLVRPAARLPSALRRQQLLRLSGEGWARVLDASWDATARQCLALWAARGLPLVVARQPVPAADTLATGLPAPARFRRLRLAVAVARLLPRPGASAWRALLATLSAADCAPRVYGGYGWQALTRLAYVHAASDIDLLLPVVSSTQADAVARLLANAAWTGPRLDGELLFPDGAAVAWREWLAHRDGRTPQVLVKRLHGVALEAPGASFA